MRIVAAISLACFVALGGCAERRALHACDGAIQSQLKAPSTYHRISNGSIDAADNGPIRIKITYDADNAFGTPIRGQGYCEYHPGTGHASWQEMPAFAL